MVHFSGPSRQIQSVSLPVEPLEGVGTSLLIELMEVFLEQGEFCAWKRGIIYGLL